MPVDSLLLQGINAPQRSRSSISSLSLGPPLGCFLMALLQTSSLRNIESRLEDSEALPRVSGTHMPGEMSSEQVHLRRAERLEEGEFKASQKLK